MKRQSKWKSIEKSIRRVFVDEEPFSRELFEYALEEDIGDFLHSKWEDGDQFFLVVTENTGHIAMLLIDEEDQIHINEDARDLLKKLWRTSYERNMAFLIPQMVEDLNDGYLVMMGVTVCDGG